MKTERINYNTNFQAKYFPKSLCENACFLKIRMRSDTVLLQGKDINQTINTRGVSIDDGKAVFKDGKYLAKKDTNNRLIPYGSDTSMIEIGNTCIIFRDNGEIIHCNKKPFFKKWSTIAGEVNMFILRAIDNYNNNEIISKISCKKETLTENGKKEAQSLIDLFNSLNPFGKK